MRFLLISTAILTAAPALADRFEAAARIDNVTVYPWGADIGRSLRIDLPAGTHELVIPGIPADIDAASLRITTEGAALGTVNLQQRRVQPAQPDESAEFLAAEQAYKDQLAALAQHDARVGAIRARGAAAKDVIDFLMKLAQSNGSVSDLPGLTGSARDELAAARQTIASAEAEALAADRDRPDLLEELERAKARLEAQRPPQQPTGALVIALQGQGGPADIRIRAMDFDASWQPVYDLSLQRKQGQLRMDRGLLVAQNTGEDWRDVTITLSTARPLDRAAPAELSPNFLAITKGKGGGMSSRSDMQIRPYIDVAAEAAPVMADSAIQGSLGETVIYDYPAPVTIRSNADALRLPLDSHELTPQILAEAVPRLESTAYLVADTVNSTGAVILPGEASFFADGALVGRGQLELTAAGDKMKLGFGPLTGITLERRLPQENEGDRGLIVKSSERTETATLQIRNLTAEEWPLRVIDQIPVSRQEDLQIDWSADPKPDETDPDGKRGLLVWTSPISAGETRQITMTTRLRWPDGQELTSGDEWNALRQVLR